VADRVPPELMSMHRVYNRNSADCWDAFDEHRRRVMGLVMDAGGESLGILGAGNGNDLDYPALCARFREIHLVDLDEQALKRARERQPPELARALVLHPQVDLSGAFARLPALKTRSPTLAELQILSRQAAEQVAKALPFAWDTVVDACILSQIMHSCRRVLGNHPGLQNIATAVAVAHLRALVSLAKPDGTAIFVTDVVSSETYPLEELWAERRPMDLLDHVESTDNMFTNVGPAFIRRVLARDEVIAPLVKSIQLVEPWLWQMGTKVTLLTYAVVIKRNGHK
jgi:hypothetical protein